MLSVVSNIASRFGWGAVSRKPLPDNDNLSAPLKNDNAAVHQVQTFAGFVGGVAKTYRWRFDEALWDSPENARAMLRDAYIRRLLNERVLPTVRASWHIDAEDEADIRQKRAVETVTAAIKAIPRFQDLRRSLMWAVWYGKAGVQWSAKRLQGRTPCWTIAKWWPVHGDKILYRWDGTPGINVNATISSQYRDQGATILPTDRGMALFLDTPNWRQRFIIHAASAEDADYQEPQFAGKINGVGLRDQSYWTWNLMQEIQGYLLDHLQRIGAGGLTLIGYDAGNDASLAAARQVGQDLRTNNVLLVPRPLGTDKQAVTVERVEPTAAGADIITGLVDNNYKKTLELLFVGQSMSSGADHSNGLGGSGRAKFAQATKEDLIASDCDSLDETLTDWLVQPILRWNCPGADFRLRYVSDKETPDPKEQLDAAKQIFDMGGELIADELYGLVGLGIPKPGDETLSKAKDAAASAQANPMAGMMPGGPPGSPPGAPPDPNAPPPAGPDGQPAAPEGQGPQDVPTSADKGVHPPTSADVGDIFREAVHSGRLFDPAELPKIKAQLAAMGGGQSPQDDEDAPVPMARVGDFAGEFDDDDTLHLARERAHWTPYRGEDGRSGWKSAGGRVVYEDPEHAPEDHPQGRKQAEGAPADAQPGPGDKVRRHAGTQRGVKGQSLSTQKQIEGMLADPESVTPESMSALVDHLMTLTTPELQALRRQYEGKYATRKADVAGSLAGAVGGKAAAKAESGKDFTAAGNLKPGAAAKREASAQNERDMSSKVRDRIMSVKGAIRAGEMRLESKVNGAGERLSAGELEGIRKSVESGKSELKRLRQEGTPQATPAEPAKRDAAKPKSEVHAADFSRHEAAIASLPREKGVILSSDGKVIAQLDQGGDATELNLSADQERAAKGNVFLHNHPDATAPSVGDFFQASRLDVSQMRVATADGVYVLGKPAGGWPPWGKIVAAEQIAGREALAETDRRHAAGEFASKGDARKFLRDETATRLASALGIDYQKNIGSAKMQPEAVPPEEEAPAPPAEEVPAPVAKEEAPQPAAPEKSADSADAWKSEVAARLKAGVTVYRGTGRGTGPNDHGVAGKGEYHSGSKQVAGAYGPNVNESVVKLDKPLVATYGELNRLQESLYGKSLTGFEPDLSEKFDGWLRDNGYDGVALFDPEISKDEPQEVVRLGEKSAEVPLTDNPQKGRIPPSPGASEKGNQVNATQEKPAVEPSADLIGNRGDVAKFSDAELQSAKDWLHPKVFDAKGAKIFAGNAVQRMAHDRIEGELARREKASSTMAGMIDKAASSGIDKGQIAALQDEFPEMKSEAWWRQNAHGDPAKAVRHQAMISTQRKLDAESAKFSDEELLDAVKKNRRGQSVDDEMIAEAHRRGMIGMSEAMNRDSGGGGVKKPAAPQPPTPAAESPEDFIARTLGKSAIEGTPEHAAKSAERKAEIAAEPKAGPKTPEQEKASLEAELATLAQGQRDEWRLDREGEVKARLAELAGGAKPAAEPKSVAATQERPKAESAPSPVDAAAKAYHSAGDTSVPQEQFDAAVASVAGMTKDQLGELAKAVDYEIGPGATVGATRAELAQRMTDRRGAAVRRGLINPSDVTRAKYDAQNAAADAQHEAGRKAVADAAARFKAAYAAAPESLTEDAIDAALEPLHGMAKADVIAVAKAAGVNKALAGKGQALAELRRKLADRRDTHARVQAGVEAAPAATPPAATQAAPGAAKDFVAAGDAAFKKYRDHAATGDQLRSAIAADVAAQFGSMTAAELQDAAKSWGGIAKGKSKAWIMDHAVRGVYDRVAAFRRTFA